MFSGKNRLNRYISHYETLSYDREAVLQSHHRAKRSLSDPNSAVNLQFKAHSRTFNLRLKRDLSTFSDNLVIVDSHGSSLSPSQADTAHIYSGHLAGELQNFTISSFMLCILPFFISVYGLILISIKVSSVIVNWNVNI